MDRFNPDDWKLRISRAAAGVAAAQANYRDELDQLFQQRSRRDTEIFPPIAPYHPSEILRSLYWQACSGTSHYDERHYGPLRAALAEACRVLAMHPALVRLVGPADTKVEFAIRIANRGAQGRLSALLAGLVSRAAELGERGLNQAATELNTLLDPPNGHPANLDLDNVLVGFHVVLMHGLRIADQVNVDGDMAIVPLQPLDAFVDRRVIHNVAPEIVNRHSWNSVAAIIKPFRWKPQFYLSNQHSEPELDWGGTFSEDATALIELLALFQEIPVIQLVAIPYCIHRTASHLLGQFHYHGSYSWGRSVQNLDIRSGSGDLSLKALNAARTQLRYRGSDRYRHCEPVIARLAEALARSGRFHVDDKILDVAIALEQLYQPEGDAISFKLKTRAACFLEARADRRLRVFRHVGELYDARSSIVHRRRKGTSAESKTDAFENGFDVARRTVVKLLHEGPPSKWDEMVIGGVEGHQTRSRTSAGTTEPGYRNRNDQIVVRKTDLPGNDHNQRVYVLECGRCQRRYGANGSDIWQRRCPQCGGGRPGLSFEAE